MKITPVATGTGVPAQSNSSLGQTVNPERLAAAKAIAAGEAPPQSSGDPQVDRTQASIKKIKMKTQVSQNRHETPIVQEIIEQPAQDAQSTISDTTEPAGEPEETRPLSPQFAALAKAKRALQVKEREIAQREEALRTQSPAGNEEYISKADLLANPMKVFEAGVTYDQLTEAILSNQSGQTFDAKTIDQLVEKKLNERLEKEFGSRDSQAEQQVLNDIKREIVQTVNSQPEQYEAIRQAKAYEDVKELIHRTWKQTGEVLDTTEAADLVENQLIEEALPFARIKKVQSRLTPAQELAAMTPAPAKPGTKIMRTLTNRDSASPIMDRRQRAIAAMQGTLKRG